MKANSITMTVKETAQYLGVSKELIYKLIRENKFAHALRIGCSLRIQRADLEKWIEEQTELESKRVLEKKIEKEGGVNV